MYEKVCSPRSLSLEWGENIWGTKISRCISYLWNITQFFIGLILSNDFLIEIAKIFTSEEQVRFRERNQLMKGEDIWGIDNIEYDVREIVFGDVNFLQ
jgi:hypothetical protein